MHPLIIQLLEKGGVRTFQNPDQKPDNHKSDLEKCFSEAFTIFGSAVVSINEQGVLFVVADFEQLWEKRFTVSKTGIKTLLVIPEATWTDSVRRLTESGVEVIYLGK